MQLWWCIYKNTLCTLENMAILFQCQHQRHKICHLSSESCLLWLSPLLPHRGETWPPHPHWPPTAEEFQPVKLTDGKINVNYGFIHRPERERESYRTKLAKDVIKQIHELGLAASHYPLSACPVMQRRHTTSLMVNGPGRDRGASSQTRESEPHSQAQENMTS